jgi:hypothetical protein
MGSETRQQAARVSDEPVEQLRDQARQYRLDLLTIDTPPGRVALAGFLAGFLAVILLLGGFVLTALVVYVLGQVLALFGLVPGGEEPGAFPDNPVSAVASLLGSPAVLLPPLLQAGAALAVIGALVAVLRRWDLRRGDELSLYLGHRRLLADISAFSLAGVAGGLLLAYGSGFLPSYVPRRQGMPSRLELAIIIAFLALLASWLLFWVWRRSFNLVLPHIAAPTLRAWTRFEAGAEGRWSGATSGGEEQRQE